jgi:hypothetical protein
MMNIMTFVCSSIRWAPYLFLTQRHAAKVGEVSVSAVETHSRLTHNHKPTMVPSNI